MRVLMACTALVFGACSSVGPSGAGGGSGGGGSGGGGGSSRTLRFTSLSGSYGGTATSIQAPTWTDRVQNRVDLSLSASNDVGYALALLTQSSASPSINFVSNLISGQKRVEDNLPADACAPLSVPITDSPFTLAWAVTGAMVTVTLEIFPAAPFSCGYASWVVTPPQKPSAVTTMSALESGSPVELHFMGASTYVHPNDSRNTDALTWDFTLTVQSRP